jgi:hypothetical protein
MEGETMNNWRLSRGEEERTERGWALDARAWKVLDLIVAEFESDPMSVQCFDLRTVAEAKAVITEARALDAASARDIFKRPRLG